MGIVVGVFGESGDGKTTSAVINPDGSCDFTEGKYDGMNPDTHFILNLDLKELPFPRSMWGSARKNYVATDDIEVIRKTIEYCASNPMIKSVQLDTLNLFLAYKEYNERKKVTFDQWRDIAIA